jgi:hypothetical protein
MLNEIRNPNLDDLKTLINKILVLQKYSQSEFQIFLRNVVLYELENIKSAIQIQQEMKQRFSAEFMKKKPSLAKTSKPGKRN